MANYTEPFQAVLDYAYPKLQEHAYFSQRENTLLTWLKTNCNVSVSSFGEYIRIPFAYGHTDDSTNMAADPYDSVSTTALTDQDALKFRVAGFALPIIASNFQKDVLIGEGKNRIYDWYLSLTKRRMKAALRKLSVDMFSNNGGTATDIAGLDYLVDQSDTSYGGFTRAATGNYKGLWPAEDTTTTAITWGAMENLYMDAHAATDVILTTKDVFGFIWALRQPQERYNPDGGGQELGAVGAPVMHFNHIPITWDENCTTASAYFLSKGSDDDKHLIYFTHSGDWNLTAEKIAEKTDTQEVSIGRIKWAGQLCMPQGQYQGRLSAITS